MNSSNILIDNMMVCHIGDFGLSVDAMAEDSNGVYSGEIGGKVPVRWTAIEVRSRGDPCSELTPQAITMQQFSSASDVWSFGIALWEMMTFVAMLTEVCCSLWQVR